MKEKVEGDSVGVMGGGSGVGCDTTITTDITTTTTATDVNGNLPPNDLQLQTSRGGPRLLAISRSEQGFGFTLRHFIVYPPELSELLGEHVGDAASSITSIEPLDTIFVKHVKHGSSAHLAGLRTGDRVVSVNGESVNSRTYQEVVALIQRSPPTLQLLVVPREEDLLQQVFGDTAHNPESNLDLRMPSPSPLPFHQPIRQQPPPPADYPPSLSPSAWSSQSSLSSHISAMSTGPHPPPVMMAHPPIQRPHQSPMIPGHPHTQANLRGNPPQGAPQSSSGRKHSLNAGGIPQSQSTPGNRKQSLPAANDKRKAVYTIQNTLSSVPHHVPSVPGNNSPVPTSTNMSTNEPSGSSVFGVYEPILDRALVRGGVRDSRRLERDPDGRIYEVVQTRVVESKLAKGESKKVRSDQNDHGTHVGRKSSVGGEAEAKRVRVQSLSPPRLRVDPAHLRSASVNTKQDGAKLIRDVGIHGSHQSLRSTKDEVITQSGNRLHRARRSCTEPITWNSDLYQSNDKTQEVIERIKRNVERKEEFLKRPNQPIWLPASKAPVVHKDYHVNPQRFPRPLWPPPGAQTPPSPGAITKALSFIVTPKQEHHQLRRVKSEIEHRPSKGKGIAGASPDSENARFVEDGMDKENSVVMDGVTSANVPRSLVGNSVPKPYTSSTSDVNSSASRFGKAFISTLSRIQENIPIAEMGSSSSLSSQGRPSSRKGDSSQSCTPYGTPSGSQTSLNSPSIRSIPLAWVGDNERIKQLQIVSRRAKQFEMNMIEKEGSGKSAFHRYELSRLSQRSKIPNVAQRKQEFENKDGDQLPSGFEFEFGTHYTNSPRQRKSAEVARCERISYDMSPSPPKVFRSLSDGGNLFPVSRHLYSPTPEEMIQISAALPDAASGPRVSMNRTVPVGGPHIHCEPPKSYLASLRPQSDSDMLERERSNSVCSQVSMTSVWSTQSTDETGNNRGKAVARQNSYLSALRSPLPVATPSASGTSSGSEVVGVVTSAATPTVSTISAPTTTTSTSVTTPTNAAMVSRRSKTGYEDEGERLVRRVSYLKATSGERMYSDSDLDSDIDDSATERSNGIELVRVVGGVVATPSTPAGPLCVGDLPSPASLHSAVVRQGLLNVKLTIVDGKKAGDRSWKNVWAVVQGRALIFYKDRQHALQTPLGVEEQISLRGAEVEVASDYTKRRNVLRLATPGGSQLLLQADTTPEMLNWLSTLQDNCTIQEGEAGTKTPMNNNNVSPQTSNKGMRKLTSSLRTRSPTGQSPSTKSRKPSNIESNSSPKSKTWRGHLVRPFMKKMQGGSPAVTPTTPLPEGATIGVCLEDCPQSLENEFVPLLVALCISVIESRGLQTQGIYRIPGNKAAVTHLTEMLNKGPKAIDYNDPRWSDVNVISSMLKQFFQKLPDPLFTCELYPNFIEASKIEDPSQRMMELKRLVHDLPDHHYETLRFLMMHLSHIVSQSEFNKMDVRNLAIVFGPTLVRSGDDNMVTMVTDMSHQCRIVETLISQAAWFFSEEEGEEAGPPVIDSSDALSPAGEPLPGSIEPDTPSSQAMLLHNINKVEGNVKGDMKKDIVSSIISAANRKVHKVKYKKTIEDKIDDSKYSDKEGGFEERDIDKEAELRKNRLLAKQMESMVELPDPKPMSERKISNMSLMSVQSQMSGVSNASQSSSGDRTSGSEHPKPEEDGRLFCVVKSDGVGASTTSLSSSTSTLTGMPTNQQSSQLAPEAASLLGDEVAIRSYAGLSASTQERIRRFEMETRAMLHRDLTKHRRETERRDVERRRLEEMWQRAKQDMESEDILDQLADNPSEVVRKISDYSWRMQGLSESVGGERGSLASQGSSSSSQAALISAVLSHHPLSNTSLTPTTNVSTQVSNTTTFPQPPSIQIVNAPTAGMACDSVADSKHGLTQQQSLRWLEYNVASPHSTLGSTSSSSSSGYGSLTRSTDNRDIEEMVKTDETCQVDPNKSLNISHPPSSPSKSKKKKSSKGPGIVFGLTSSSSSPSLFPSMVEGAAELTPTRKIGQTVIYPESPRPPPHSSRLSTQSRPAQVTASSSTLTPHPNTPQLGRHKDSVLHHILPSRLYHSPRPLRRGSSAENVTQNLNIPQSPSTFDTQRVVNNGTLKRARANRDQILNGPEMGMARCSSLDSLREGPQAPDDGSDLLSAITATFEEKMRSLQESPLGLMTASVSDDSISNQDNTQRKKPECRLYRDPSLHRRRPSNKNTPSTTCDASTPVSTTTNSKVEDVTLSNKYSVEENKVVVADTKCEVKVKRSDSLTKSEKTENNMKEKTEKRARELKRTDTQESLNEKKPKEMKRSDTQDAIGRSRDLPRKSDTKESSSSVKRNSEVRSRKHNVKELKEKFEQNTGTLSNNSSPIKLNNCNNKGNKSGMRRTGYRGQIKRRHTVGGTKDLAKWAWLQSGEVVRNASRSTRLSAWERLQPLVTDERLNTDRSLEAWLARERIRTSSPDLSRPQHLVLPCDVDDKENLHRRLSVQEATLNPLYPVLESHV